MSWHSTDSQNNDNRFLIKAFVIAVLVASICLNACSTVRLNAIPPPSPSAKLRVFVQIISEEPRGRYYYGIPSDRWARIMISNVDRYLVQTGIYEVVPKEDTQAVLGIQAPGSEQYLWVKKDYALLRQAGKALYADYAIIIIRTFKINIEYKMILINIETGAQYTTADTLLVTTSLELNLKTGTRLLQNMYRQIFYDAKGDLLATAIRKGRLMPGGEITKPATRETKLALAPPPVSNLFRQRPKLQSEKSPLPFSKRYKSQFLLYPQHKRRQKHQFSRLQNQLRSMQDLFCRKNLRKQRLLLRNPYGHYPLPQHCRIL